MSHGPSLSRGVTTDWRRNVFLSQLFIRSLLPQVRNISTLAETAIYVATVEKYTEVLREILNWVAENKEEVGDIKMENADCILHAALEDDKDQVMLEH